MTNEKTTDYLNGYSIQIINDYNKNNKKVTNTHNHLLNYEYAYLSYDNERANFGLVLHQLKIYYLSELIRL